MVQNESERFGIQSVNSEAIVTKFVTIIIYSFGNNPAKFRKIPFTISEVRPFDM